jgi:hypothetical protein
MTNDDKTTSPASSSSSSSGTTTTTPASSSASTVKGKRDEQYAGHANPVHSVTEDEARQAHEDRLEQLRLEAEAAAENQPISHFNASAPEQAPAVESDDKNKSGKNA